MISINVFEHKNAELGKEFDRYVLEHPAFAAKLPGNAHIALQVEGDGEFNEWARRVAEHNHEVGQPLVYVKYLQYYVLSTLGPGL